MPFSGAILIVEDDEADMFILERALRAAGLKNRLMHLTSAEEAMRYLASEGKYADRDLFPFPQMLITDCRTNVGSGLDLLRFMRETRNTRVVPTIFLTGSHKPGDIREAYELGAHAFIIKTGDVEKFTCCIKTLVDFWTNCAEVPPCIV